MALNSKSISVSTISESEASGVSIGTATVFPVTLQVFLVASSHSEKTFFYKSESSAAICLVNRCTGVGELRRKFCCEHFYLVLSLF